jgi:hypothetical protein
MTFIGMPQCDHGTGQAQTPIHSEERVQDYAAMNVQVLSNPLAWFCCNE